MIEPIPAAKDLIRVAGVTKAPVPVERIARSLGIQVRYAPLDGDISGMALIKDGVKIIGVNSLHHPNRQRFTLAHELGHIHLHEDTLLDTVHLDKGSLRRDSLASAGTDRIEIDANTFAAELLVPEALLNAALESAPIDLEDDDAIDRLARKFRVSVTAMHYRLRHY